MVKFKVGSEGKLGSARFPFVYQDEIGYTRIARIYYILNRAYPDTIQFILIKNTGITPLRMTHLKV